jgi:hypothetical protein
MQDEKFADVTKEIEVSLGPLKIKSTKWLNFTALAALAIVNATALTPHVAHRGGVDLSASATQLEFEYREVTGEDILAMTERVGGRVDPESLKYDEAGLITEITASIDTAYEYDYDEMLSVLDSIQATAPTPKKLLGDLAQTSVLVTGTQTQVVGLAEWTISWKRKTADATTTDDAEYESSLGSTKSWTVKSKYMFIDGDTSQNTYVLAAINTLQNDSSLWNFFPTVETGRAAFQGQAIVDGIDISTGMGKCVGTDVSLKGTGPLTMLVQSAPIANPNTVTGQSAQVPTS